MHGWLYERRRALCNMGRGPFNWWRNKTNLKNLYQSLTWITILCSGMSHNTVDLLIIVFFMSLTCKWIGWCRRTLNILSQLVYKTAESPYFCYLTTAGNILLKISGSVLINNTRTKTTGTKQRRHNSRNGGAFPTKHFKWRMMSHNESTALK